ncbi:MAG: DUF1573 domain-containing protein [Fimbriimonadaceae bacterium]|nr:DUF1573 domain-containing protein [Fimbriimonadaceae bacterium]
MVVLSLFLASVFPFVQAKPLGPVVPPGANASFVRACLNVQESLAAGDFVRAAERARALPSARPIVRLDLAGVPPERRREVGEALERANDAWRPFVRSLEVSRTGRADLVLSFAETLPPAVPGGDPGGAAHLFSEAPQDPRLETVIALKRGPNKAVASAVEIQAEMQYALGAYFGVAWLPLKGSSMGRTDLAGLGRATVLPIEGGIARRLLECAEEHRRLVESKTSVEPARPRARIDPLRWTGKPVRQGDDVSFSVQIDNQGNAPLSVLILPDCSCLTPKQVNPVPPGESAMSTVRVDTIDFLGDLQKRMEILTNDVDFPTRTFDFRLRVEPLYRIIAPSGPGFVAKPDGTTEFDAYLVMEESVRLKPSNPRIDGIAGSVMVTPWVGTLADPESNEAAKPRRGYRLHVKIGSLIPPGRPTAAIVLDTDHPIFKRMQYGFTVQKGIVALPETVYLGEVGKAPTDFWFLVSRPGQPFKITSLTCMNKSLSLRLTPHRNGSEYRIDGKVASGLLTGRFEAIVVIKTDDPRQPTIRVPVQAIVR